MLLLAGRSWQNKVYNEIEQIKRQLQDSSFAPGRGIIFEGKLIGIKKYMFYGIITALGPASEADYADERYWVKEQYCNNSIGDSTTAVTFANKAAPLHVTATNLAEIAGSTHSLSAGAYVQVWYIYDVQTPPKLRFIFNTAV